MSSKKPNFAHLHVHSQFSLLDGACRINGLIEKVKKEGMDSVALTDHGTMAGLPYLQKAADKAGIKSILGIEAYMTDDRHIKEPGDKRYHLTLLAENDKGYENLCHLTSKAFSEGYYHKPRMDYDLFEKYNEGIIVLTGCMASKTMTHLRNDDPTKAREEIERLMSIFGEENVYLEIQNAGVKGQTDWNRELSKIGKAINRPVVATGDVHYLNEADAEPHDVMLCVQTHRQVSDTNRMSMLPQKYHLKTQEEVLNDLSDYPNALNIAQEIADRCNARIYFGQKLLPKFETPNNETSEDYLRTLVVKGLKEKNNGEDLTKEQLERIEFELGTINNMGFPDYFLIVQDYINWANENNIPTGPGRGSAAGSLIAYALGVTHLDPLDYDLLFERFLNPDRISMPDIDVDFSQEGRDRVIQYCVNKYGADCVSNIGTFGTVGAKVGVRDAARALGYEYKDGDRIARLIPDEIGISLEEALKTPDLKKAYDSEKMVKEVVDQALWMEGLVKSAGVHASAILIAPDSLDNFIPMRTTKSGTKKIDVYNSQYDGTTVDEIGLLKMDFLGLRNLDIIQESERLIKASTGEDVIVRDAPLDDKKTLNMLAKGDSVGVFQFESTGMQDTLRYVGVDKFDDLIAIVSLYRPGGMEQIPTYAKNKRNPDAIHWLDKRLKPILEPTYGTAPYQENLMRISRDLAGFTAGESDELRKIIGKKLVDKLPDLKKKFMKGCAENNTSKDVAEQLWRIIEAAGNYSFNKSHAACYAYVSYMTAWLKANYPTQYMAALLTSVMNTKDKVPFYLYETRRMGIKIEPPHVNESYSGFTVIKEGNLRFGLEAIKNVGSKVIDMIIEDRNENGNFLNIWDFARRVPEANKRSVEFLIQAGAFDNLGSTRKALLESIDEIMNVAKKQRKQVNVSNEGTLFESIEAELEEHLTFEDPVLEGDEFPYQEMLEKEMTSLGVYASGHPVEEDREAWEQTATIKLGHINEGLEGEQVTAVGVVVESNIIRTRRDNKEMAFVTVSDPSGNQELVLFDSVISMPGVRDLLKIGSMITIIGRVMEDKRNDREEIETQDDIISDAKEKKLKLICQRIGPFDPSLIDKREVLTIDMKENQFNKETVSSLKTILRDHAGLSPVKIILSKDDNTSQVYRLGDDLQVNITDDLKNKIKKLLN